MIARALPWGVVLVLACADDEPVADPDALDQGTRDATPDASPADALAADFGPDLARDVRLPDRAVADAGPAPCEVTVDGDHVCALSLTEYVCEDFARCFCEAVTGELVDTDVERCVSGLFELRALRTLADLCYSPGTTMDEVLRGEWQEAVGVRVTLVGTAGCADLLAVNPECNHDADCQTGEICLEVCDDNCLGYPSRGCCDRACVPDSAPYVCESQDTRRCAQADSCPPGFVRSVDFGEALWDCACCLADSCGGEGHLVCDDHPSCVWTPSVCPGFCRTPNEGACAGR